MRIAVAVAVAVLCALLAGCASSQRDVEASLALKAQRDSGQITWVQWAEQSAPLVYKTGSQYAAKFNSDRMAIALAVDGKIISPQEGAVMVEIARGRAIEAESQRPDPALVALNSIGKGMQAAGQTPQPTFNYPRSTTTSCAPSANGARLVCTTQ